MTAQSTILGNWREDMDVEGVDVKDAMHVAKACHNVGGTLKAVGYIIEALVSKEILTAKYVGPSRDSTRHFGASHGRFDNATVRRCREASYLASPILHSGLDGLDAWEGIAASPGLISTLCVLVRAP